VPEEPEGAEPVSVGSVAELSHFIESQKQKKQQQQQGGGGGGKAGSSKKHSAPNSAKTGNQSRSASKKDKSSTNGTDTESVAEEASPQRIPSGKKRGGRPNPSPHVAPSASAAAKKRARSKRELDADASALALSASKRRGGFRSAKSLLLSALGVLLAALIVYALFFTTLAPDESVPNNKPRTTTQRT